MWRKLFQASLNHQRLPTQHLKLLQYQCSQLKKGEPVVLSIPASWLFTSTPIPSDITKKTGQDDDVGKVRKKGKQNSRRTSTIRGEGWEVFPAKQKRPPKRNPLMMQFAMDVVSNRDPTDHLTLDLILSPDKLTRSEYLTDLSIRKKSKYLKSERTKMGYSKSRTNNVLQSEDNGYEAFEDIVGMDVEDDDDDDSGYDDSNPRESSYYRAYKSKSPIGLFMIQANGYNNSCMIKVLENRTKHYNAETDNTNVQQLADFLAKDDNVPLDIFTAGVQSLCRIPADKLDALVGLHLPYSLPKAACALISKLTSDALPDVVLAMAHLHCKLQPDEVKTVEKECLKHLTSWDLNSMLLMSDCWLHMSPDVKLSYHLNMVELATNDIYYGTELTDQDVVQLFYIMRLSKTSPQTRGFYSKLLQKVTNSLDSLTWGEIANICFAMVKTHFVRTAGDHDFLNALGRKLSAGLRNKEVDMYCTTSIMRCLASSYYDDVETFNALAEYLIPIIKGSGKDTDTSVKYMKLHIGHVAMAFSKLRIFHEPLMDAIADYVLYSESRHRCKDVHLLLWAFGRLHYKPEENTDRFFQQLIHELRFKEASREMFPETILGSLVSLSFLGYYPDDLIDQVFSPAYLQVCEDHMRTAGLDPLCRHLFTLDCSVAVECPHYNGNRLPERIIRMYKDVRHGSSYHLGRMETYGRSSVIIKLLRQMLGPDSVKIRPILPHIKTPADIEVHLDMQGKSVMPHSSPSDDSLGQALTDVAIPYYELDKFVKATAQETSKASEIHRIAVMVNSPLHYHSNSQQLLGAHVMKRRQLRRVGHKIIEIPYFEWNIVGNKYQKMKINYLQDKLDAVIRTDDTG